MTRRIVVVGAGGFGREVLDVVDATGTFDGGVTGVLDDQPSEENLARLARRGTPYLGTVASWLERGDEADYVIGVADPGARRRIDLELAAAGLEAATLVHPVASLGAEVSLEPGVIVCAGARLTTNIHLGRHAHVHVNATIGHDTRLGAYASAFPLSAVSGACDIGDGATVGAHAVVLQGRRVGDGALVGAGAVVTHDVPGSMIVKGVPAR